MRLLLRNPTPLQWGIIGGTLALGMGVVAGALGSRRRLPSITEPDEEPQIVDADDPDRIAPADPARPLEQWQAVMPNEAGYPWEFPAMHYQNYPTPGTWFDGNAKGVFDPAAGFDAFVRALLGSALAMAGADPAIATAEGQSPNAALGRRLRRMVRDSLIVVGGVNDLLYGQTNLNWAGGNDPSKPGGDPSKGLSATYVLNEEGRGLNWLPRHADNVARISKGSPLRRATTLEGEPLPPPDRGTRQMVIWAPAYDLDALGSEQPTIQYLTWSDGSSTLGPPPFIQGLGIDLSGVELPGVAA